MKLDDRNKILLNKLDEVLNEVFPEVHGMLERKANDEEVCVTYEFVSINI